MKRITVLLLGVLAMSSGGRAQPPAETTGQTRDVAPVDGAVRGELVETVPNPWGLPDDPLLGFVEIPEGPFTMGSDGGDELADAGEEPTHPVTLPMYFIGKYEVTVAQFAAFVEDAAYEADPRSLVGPADHPVRDVSWHDAMAYCAWLTGKLRAWTGTPPALADVLRGGDDLGAGLAGPRRVLPAWQVTLPSEAEWEKAARGDDARDYPWGNGLPNSTRASYSATEPSAVGSHPAGASPFEVFDMAGNVFEWTRSLWGPDVSRARFRYPYEPDDGRENLEAPATIRRVLRGGSFRLGPDGISTTRRFRYDPDSRFGTRGFRLAVSLLVPLPPVSPDPPASPISSPSPISPPVPALPGRD